MAGSIFGTPSGLFGNCILVMTHQAKWFEPSIYANYNPLSHINGQIGAPVLGQKSVDFHIYAQIFDKSGKHLISEFDIPCGAGEQRIRWLALVVTQKLATQSAAHGRRRAFERSKLKNSFHLPSEVIDSNGVTVDHGDTINGAFKNGEIIKVKLGSTFGTRGWEPLVTTNDFGNPVLSQFHRNAFQTSDELQALRSDPRNNRLFVEHGVAKNKVVKKSVQEAYLETKVNEHDLYSRCPVSGKRLSLKSHSSSALFRRTMSRQMLYRNTFGLMNEAEYHDEIKNSVQHEFSFIKLDLLAKEEEERVKLAEVFVKYFPDLNQVFKNYWYVSSYTSMYIYWFTKNLFDLQCFHRLWFHRLDEFFRFLPYALTLQSM